jgi:TetR/AcrR family transcriptional regulator, transcriptional repressor for nem operon
LLKEIVEEGKRAGTIGEDVEVDKLSNLIIGGVEGAMLIGRIERTDQALRDALEHLNEYLEKQVRRVG